MRAQPQLCDSDSSGEIIMVELDCSYTEIKIEDSNGIEETKQLLNPQRKKDEGIDEHLANIEANLMGSESSANEQQPENLSPTTQFEREEESKNPGTITDEKQGEVVIELSENTQKKSRGANHCRSQSFFSDLHPRNPREYLQVIQREEVINDDLDESKSKLDSDCFSVCPCSCVIS